MHGEDRNGMVEWGEGRERQTKKETMQRDSQSYGAFWGSMET
jgi:type III secretory pathway component EscV